MMKYILFTLFCLLAVSHCEPSSPRTSANINQYLDKLLIKVKEMLINKGLDPFQMEDIKKDFSQKIGLVTFHGEMDLTRGWAQGASDLRRFGDAEMSYQAHILDINVPLEFDFISVDYDFSAKIMSLGPTGGLNAKITDLRIVVEIAVDTKTLEVVLQNFQITNSGSISVKFSGHPLVDWLFNTLTKLTTTLLHGTVQGIVERQGREVLEETIEEINKMRPNVNGNAYVY